MRPTIDDVLKSTETVIIGNGSPEFRDVRDKLGQDQILIDLVRAFGAIPDDKRYRGIAW
jgi:GDP-mannose 6-dehydrogenase